MGKEKENINSDFLGEGDGGESFLLDALFALSLSGFSAVSNKRAFCA